MGGGEMGLISAILGSIGHPAAIPLVIPAWLVTTWATARTVFHSSSRRRERELEALADRLAALVRESMGEQPR